MNWYMLPPERPPVTAMNTGLAGPDTPSTATESKPPLAVRPRMLKFVPATVTVGVNLVIARLSAVICLLHHRNLRLLLL